MPLKELAVGNSLSVRHRVQAEHVFWPVSQESSYLERVVFSDVSDYIELIQENDACHLP